ncbi:MAG: hypothetical protein WDN04_15735 [Rhodospirillales bacterium]
MSPRRRYKPYAWEPFCMTRTEVAEAVFRRSESWFLDHCPAGFPQPVDGLYATEAVREWVRTQHGIAGASNSAQAAERLILERLGKGTATRAISRR